MVLSGFGVMVDSWLRISADKQKLALLVSCRHCNHSPALLLLH